MYQRKHPCAADVRKALWLLSVAILTLAISTPVRADDTPALAFASFN